MSKLEKNSLTTANNDIVKLATSKNPEDYVSKEKSIYDLINILDYPIASIKEFILQELIFLNAAMSEKLQLTNEMLKMLVTIIIDNFDTITPGGLRKAIRQGISGQYGQIYQMNVNTVLSWIRKYQEEDIFDEETGEPIPGSRTYQLRQSIKEKREREKSEFTVNGERNLASALRAALNLNNKVREFKPNQKHLDLFKKIVPTFTDEEIEKGIKDWNKRQRPQYLEILESEKKKRNFDVGSS